MNKRPDTFYLCFAVLIAVGTFLFLCADTYAQEPEQTFWPLYEQADESAYDTWLYDRASVFDTDEKLAQYLSLLYTADDCPGSPCRGYFKLKNADPGNPYPDFKYSYAKPIWLASKRRDLTDEEMAKLEDVLAASEHAYPLSKPWTPTTYFTERDMAYVLEAAVYYDRVHGIESDRQRHVVDWLRGAQDESGCFIHNVEMEPPAGFSPWMSSLLYFALKASSVSGSDEMADRMAACVNERGLYLAQEQQLVMPCYIALAEGGCRQSDEWSDFDHAQDVWLMTGNPDLDITRQYAFNYWTNDDGTARKLSPVRKYAWWFRNASIEPVAPPDSDNEITVAVYANGTLFAAGRTCASCEVILSTGDGKTIGAGEVDAEGHWVKRKEFVPAPASILATFVKQNEVGGETQDRNVFALPGVCQ